MCGIIRQENDDWVNLTVSEGFEGENARAEKDRRHMLDFLQDMYSEYPIQTFYRHTYPLIGYSASQVTGERHNPQLIFPIPTVDFLGNEKDWTVDYNEHLNKEPLPGWERGIVNRVIGSNEILYIPMFDMKGIFYDSPSQLQQAFNGVVPGYALTQAKVYFTGNSYHVYLPIVMTQKEWHDTLYSLLANVDHPSLSFGVDLRWVGHTLQQGFTAIRISNFNPAVKPVKPYLVYENGKGLGNNPAMEAFRAASDLPF